MNTSPQPVNRQWTGTEQCDAVAGCKWDNSTNLGYGGATEPLV